MTDFQDYFIAKDAAHKAAEAIESLDPELRQLAVDSIGDEIERRDDEKRRRKSAESQRCYGGDPFANALANQVQQAARFDQYRNQQNGFSTSPLGGIFGNIW